jgi:membrane protease YdiL (CAAX protease family)
MEVSAAATAFLFVGFALFMASIWAWLLVALRMAISRGWLPARLALRAADLLTSLSLPAKLPLVPWHIRRAVPWGLIDLILLFGIWVVASLAAELVLRQFGLVRVGTKMESLALAQRKALIVANMLISLSIVGAGLPVVALRTRASRRDVGWSAGHLLSDLRLGGIGFIMLAPPVYALQGLLVQLWKPSKHPLIEMFKGTPDPAFFVLLFISAALIAPLFEELIFRVVIQGYLEKWCNFAATPRELFLGSDRTLPLALGEGRDERGLIGQSSQIFYPAGASVDPNPYASPTTGGTEVIHAALADGPTEQPELRGRWAWLPIFISSAIFALLHYSHGPDWVPLFLLAAGMGYLYQRTHRLVPSLIVHALLNAFSLWGLWVQVQAGG